MQTLYIIGNGFDLYHGLQTSYPDFHKYIKVNNPDLENLLYQYFCLKENKEYLWSNFEEDLASFDWCAFFDDNNNTDVPSDSFRYSEIYGLEDDLNMQGEQIVRDISEAFENWIIEIDLNDVPQKFNFEKNAVFLTFNYTHTLETVYKIAPTDILHIHSDIEYTKGSFIFGHNKTIEEPPELDENGNSNRTPFTDAEGSAKYPFHALYKQVEENIQENRRFFDSLSSIKKVVILGHSLNPIDLPYFSEIAKQLGETKWEVSYYTESEKEKAYSIIRKIVGDNLTVTCFKLN